MKLYAPAALPFGATPAIAHDDAVGFGHDVLHLDPEVGEELMETRHHGFVALATGRLAVGAGQ